MFVKVCGCLRPQPPTVCAGVCVQEPFVSPEPKADSGVYKPDGPMRVFLVSPKVPITIRFEKDRKTGCLNPSKPVWRWVASSSPLLRPYPTTVNRVMVNSKAVTSRCAGSVLDAVYDAPVGGIKSKRSHELALLQNPPTRMAEIQNMNELDTDTKTVCSPSPLLPGCCLRPQLGLFKDHEHVNWVVALRSFRSNYQRKNGCTIAERLLHMKEHPEVTPPPPSEDPNPLSLPVRGGGQSF